ncbi:MAG: phosphoglycerate kinase [bacterium]|nr:phosphoglycerate kinase [bacterium]
MFKKLTLEDLDVKGKRVLVRVDFNIPLDTKGEITDDLRITTALPTIRYISDNHGKAILMSHLGRPKGKVQDDKRLTPVSKRLSRLLGKEVKKMPDCVGAEVKEAIFKMKEGDIILLENLRFHIEEEKNDPTFSKELASLGDLYVNDAFAVSHRKHASTFGVPRLFPQAAAGFLLKQEVEYLDRVNNPDRPFVAIIGGAKVSTKVPIIKNLLKKVDTLIIGGGMAYTFLKALGRPIGHSLVEDDMVDVAKDILIMSIADEVPILYPIDHLIATSMSTDAQTKIVHRGGILEDWYGVDVGPLTIKKFIDCLKGAKTILWNGPLGICEIDRFSKGTRELANFIAASNALSIVGGGDSSAFVIKEGLFDKMTHVSTGGGACLQFLAGEELPGISILTDK